jgi:hypothetical protein
MHKMKGHAYKANKILTSELKEAREGKRLVPSGNQTLVTRQTVGQFAD